jgi:hypothetical protein
LAKPVADSVTVLPLSAVIQVFRNCSVATRDASVV